MTDATTISCKIFIYCHYPFKAETFDLNDVRQDCLQTRRTRGKKEKGKSKKGKKENTMERARNNVKDTTG